MRVLVLTCDKYLHALRPFSFLFNKYWGSNQPVLVGGFTPPGFELPPNFRFHSIGNQADYPLSKWSDGLIKLLQDIDDEIFVLMLEDYWIVRPVDVVAVQMLADYMRQFQYVLKIDLCADRLYALGASDYGYCGRLDLIKSQPGSPYHMSLMAGLWRRELLLHVLVPGETPWDLEIEGTRRLSALGDQMLVLGTRQWPVRHILAYRHGNPKDPKTSGLQPHDLEALKRKGWI